MKKTNGFIILMTLLPWLTVPFIGAKSLRRFLPSSIFMSLFLIAEGRFAEKKKWWWFPFNLKPNVLGKIQLSVLFLIKTLLLYGFQIIYEKSVSKLSSSK